MFMNEEEYEAYQEYQEYEEQSREDIILFQEGIDELPF